METPTRAGLSIRFVPGKSAEGFYPEICAIRLRQGYVGQVCGKHMPLILRKSALPIAIGTAGNKPSSKDPHLRIQTMDRAGLIFEVGVDNADDLSIRVDEFALLVQGLAHREEECSMGIDKAVLVHFADSLSFAIIGIP